MSRRRYNMYNTASTRMLTTSNSAVYLQPLDLRDNGVHHQTLDLRRDHQTSERPTPGGIRRDWTSQKPSILASTGPVYAEPENQYEPTDSGFTEDWSDLTSDRKADSIYTSSSSSNTGIVSETDVMMNCTKYRTHQPNVFNNQMSSIAPPPGVYAALSAATMNPRNLSVQVSTFHTGGHINNQRKESRRSKKGRKPSQTLERQNDLC